MPMSSDTATGSPFNTPRSETTLKAKANTNTLGPNIEFATKWSTAPYRGDRSEDVHTSDTPQRVGVSLREPGQTVHGQQRHLPGVGSRQVHRPFQWCRRPRPKRPAWHDPTEPEH